MAIFNSKLLVYQRVMELNLRMAIYQVCLVKWTSVWGYDPLAKHIVQSLDDQAAAQSQASKGCLGKWLQRIQSSWGLKTLAECTKI